MGRKGRHFLLLLWKNFLVQKRKVFTTVLEIGLPAFFALILIFIRLRVKEEMKENIEWPYCKGWDTLWGKEKLPKQLAFSPDNNITRGVMERVSHALSLNGMYKCLY